MDDLQQDRGEQGGDVMVRRGAASYHPKADDEFKMHREDFADRLASASANLAENDGANSVSVNHVRRAYYSLVTERKKDKAKRIISSTLMGGLISGFLSVLIAVAGQATTPTGLQIGLLAAFFVGALVSGSYLSWVTRG